MDDDVLADEFDRHRTHLRAVAQRMLGSTGEADDAVQEAWLRLTRSDADGDRQPRRLADHGRRADLPRPAPLPYVATRDRTPRDRRRRCPSTPRRPSTRSTRPMLADSVGLALLVVLDTLSPAERLAFVLHDLFAVPFDEIAPVLDRTPEATRQLASRARRRVRGSSAAPDRSRQREVVRAFLAASREGDFEGLLAHARPGRGAPGRRHRSSPSARPPRRAARGPWPRRSPAGRRPPSSRWSTACPAWPGSRATGRAWSSTSWSTATGSSASTCWATPTSSASSSCRCVERLRPLRTRRRPRSSRRRTRRTAASPASSRRSSSPAGSSIGVAGTGPFRRQPIWVPYSCGSPWATATRSSR